MARNDNTIKLFFSVTKANLKDNPCVQQAFEYPREQETHLGKRRHAMSARLSTPTALAQAPSNQKWSFQVYALIGNGANLDDLRRRRGELRMCKIRVL